MVGGRAPNHGEGDIAALDFGDEFVSSASRLGGVEASDGVGGRNPEAHGMRPRDAFEDSGWDRLGSTERGASRGAPDSIGELRSSSRASEHVNNGGGFGGTHGVRLRR